MRLVAVTIDNPLFPAVLDALQSIAERSSGDYTVESLTDDLIALQKQAYAAVEADKIYAIAITEVYELKDGSKALYLIGMTGEDRDRWHHLINELGNRAKANGCVKFKSLVRPGWVRVLKEHGFTETHRMIEKAL